MGRPGVLGWEDGVPEICRAWRPGPAENTPPKPPQNRAPNDDGLQRCVWGPSFLPDGREGFLAPSELISPGSAPTQHEKLRT